MTFPKEATREEWTAEIEDGKKRIAAFRAQFAFSTWTPFTNFAMC